MGIRKTWPFPKRKARLCTCPPVHAFREMSREGAECAWLAETCTRLHTQGPVPSWILRCGGLYLEHGSRGWREGLLCPGSMFESPDAQSLPCTSGQPQVLSVHPELSSVGLNHQGLTRQAQGNLCANITGSPKHSCWMVFQGPSHSRKPPLAAGRRPAGGWKE